ncbi:hypothetical protein F4703DRAFT_1943526 [Phycomyces blakesleeanus]
MSLGRLTVDINAHEFSTTRHGSPLDQTTEGIHRLALSFGRAGSNPAGDVVF